MKIKTLKLNKDFRRLYARGKCIVSPYFVTYFKRNGTDDIHIGITTGKKLGNAVSRNRARRLIRAAFRQNLPNLKSGYDFVFVARVRLLSSKSTTLGDIMKEQFISAGIWKEFNEQNSD
ncbi:MAG: ribonuclease P protein component [Ruminococcaceae bacterium]|nr:ribonuclease P protein component [Oscillospiraceae bacterium]